MESIAPQSEAIAAEAHARASAGLVRATLAGFAAFVRDYQLEDYVRLQLEDAKGLDLPMLRRMQDVPHETLVQHGLEGAREFLAFLAEDRGQAYIELSLSRWRQDALVLIGKLQVEVEDITGLNLVRKRVLGAMLPRYTTDLSAALAILAELDAFVHLQETAALNQFALLHQEVAASRQEFIERVSAAVPGALYVYDTARKSVQYVNAYLQSLLGYTAQEFDALRDSAIELIHPADAEEVADYFRGLTTLQNGEVRSCKYRCIHKDGSVLWLRSYNTPFRTSVDGALQQVVGFSFNITAEKLASEELKEREVQMLEAQAIARVGSYVQDLATGASRGTPELEALLETDNLNDWEQFFSRVHPDDRAEMKRALNETHERGVPYHQTYRYAGAGGWKALTARGIIERGSDGKPAVFRGTVQDVTEQQQLLEEVTEKSRLYREAQTVARMGSWSYELGSDEIYWSDELLHIYGLHEAAGYRKRAEMRMYTLEEDRDRASEVLDAAAASGRDEFEIRYRIRTAQGEIKYLHSRGTFVRNAAGRPVRVVGTVQDVTEQQALIDRLAESKQRYKEAQAIAELGSWTIDLRSGGVQWSEQMYRLLGLPVDDPALSVQSFYSRAHPQDRASLEDFFARMTAAPGEYICEYRYRSAAGGTRWLSIRGESVADAQGKPTLLRGVVQNITAQREAAERLRQQEAFIRKVTDLAPSIITVYDVHSDAYEFVSRGITTLMGYTPEAVLEGGQPFLTTRIHPDDVAARTATNAAMASEAPAPGTPEAVHEFRHRVRDAYGQYRWLHVFSTVFHRGYAGAAEKILSIAQDITERVAAEAVAREGERFVRNVTELVPSVITVTDVDTMKFVFINENGAAILGQPVQRFYDEGSAALASLVHPDDESVFYASLERALREAAAAPQSGAAEPVSETQYRIRSAGGEYRWMRALTTPFMRREDGSVQQLISITQDVTPLHQAEELLRQRATMLQQSNQSLEEFAYVASHDLQEPLRKISTFGEMLQKSAANYDDRSATFLTKIIESARRMQTLINDLLDISVISRQKGFETVSLNAVLREVLQTLEHKLESTGGTVESGPLPDATVVPAQMRQLFQNLLSNSLKFARPGVPPRIAIESRVVFGREVQELGLPPHRAYARITLTDNGIGFSNEYADKIFTIFQRLHGKSDYEGSGIGLAICKKIAEHHGGTIFASGQPGEGATFTVVLPV